MQQMEMKTNIGMAAIMWLSFAGSLSSSYDGFKISVNPLIYGSATLQHEHSLPSFYFPQFPHILVPQIYLSVSFKK